MIAKTLTICTLAAALKILINDATIMNTAYLNIGEKNNGTLAKAETSANTIIVDSMKEYDLLDALLAKTRTTPRPPKVAIKRAKGMM